MRSAVARLSLVCLSSIVFGLIFTGQGSAKIDPKALAGLWYFNEGKGNVVKELCHVYNIDLYSLLDGYYCSRR